MGLAREMIAETFNEFLEDKADRLGAALAFYAAFSVSPLLILVVAVVDRIYGGESITYIRSQIAAFLGDTAAEAIVATLRSVNRSDAGLGATIIGLITLVIGATGVFTQLQDAMNTIWEVSPKPRRLWAEMLRSRMLSFAMVLGICFLLLASLSLSALLTAISSHFRYLLPGADFALSFAVTTLLFAMIYKVLPDVYLTWRDVWIGAAGTAVLFTAGKALIGFYLGHSSFASAYGAAGSILVILAWVYYSAQILFFGAEFTRVYVHRFGRQVRPKRGAVALGELARIHQGIPHAQVIRKAMKAKRPDPEA